MVLHLTNKYGLKNSNELRRCNLEVQRNCKITNYDPREENGNKKGYITIDIVNGKATVNNGNGKGCNNSGDVANLSNLKYDILGVVAGLDGNQNDLTMKDLLEVDKTFDENLKEYYGIDTIRKDFQNGIVTFIGKAIGYLRIDFEMDNEKTTNNVDKSTNATPTKVKSKKEQTKINSSKSTSKASSGKSKQNVQSIINGFSGGYIDIKEVKDLDSVAKYTGLSKEYIKNVLINIEGNKKLPVTKAGYDGVGKDGHPIGFLTIGFGHTSLSGAPKVTEGLQITETQAYQILANDIITARQGLDNFLKTHNINKNEIPKSIYNAYIDLSYNKGPNALNSDTIVANLKQKLYAASALRTWYETNNIGLQKRNLYRFIEAIRDLNVEQKKRAVRLFLNHYGKYLNAIFSKDINAKKDWEKYCQPYSH